MKTMNSVGREGTRVLRLAAPVSSCIKSESVRVLNWKVCSRRASGGRAEMRKYYFNHL